MGWSGIFEKVLVEGCKGHFDRDGFHTGAVAGHGGGGLAGLAASVRSDTGSVGCGGLDCDCVWVREDGEWIGRAEEDDGWCGLAGDNVLRHGVEADEEFGVAGESGELLGCGLASKRVISESGGVGGTDSDDTEAKTLEVGG